MNLVQKINKFYKLAVLSDEEFSKLNDFTTPEAEEYLKHKEIESESKIKNDLKSFVELSNKLFVNYFAKEYNYQTAIMKDKQLEEIRTKNKDKIINSIRLDDSAIDTIAGILLDELKEKQYSYKSSSLYSEKHADYAVDKFFEIFKEVYLRCVGIFADLTSIDIVGASNSESTLENILNKSLENIFDMRAFRISAKSKIRKLEFKKVELEKIENWDL